MHRIIIATIALVTLAVSATELPTQIKIDKKGSLVIDGVEFVIQAYSQSWSVTTNRNWKNVKSQIAPSGATFSGQLPVGGKLADATEEILPTGENSFQLKLQAKFSEPVIVNALHGAFVIPAEPTTIRIDGKPVQVPAPNNKMRIYGNPKAKELRFTTSNGTEIAVTGNPLKVNIQDNREFGNNTISIRLGADPHAGEITTAELALDVKIKPIAIQKVDISQTSNAGFADEVANDGKGGWTDQGPENDLHMLKPGELKAGPLAFNILDPAQNAGKSAIVISGKDRNFTPATVSLALPKNKASAVNLLHASAWTPKNKGQLGTIIATYADGEEQKIQVFAGTDCGNWWNPFARSNCAVAWTSETPEAQVGLYVSSFALNRPGATSLRFEITSPESIWMIAGVTLSEQRIKVATLKIEDDKPLEIKENYQWKRLDYARKLNRGSALDFSFLADAPAGKYGRIQATPAGTLTFEKDPQKHIRLYGVNLCFSASYLGVEEGGKLADYFVYCGYNTVRIHHHDTLLTDPKASDSLTLNPEKLDQLDGLFSAMKERGLYVTTDLYTNRVFRPGDHIPECNFYDQRQMKMLIPLSRATMENWKEFARRWMLHKNPYTGLTWAEDPALWCVNLINEETLSNQWAHSPESAKLYTEAFRKYCHEKNLPASKPSNDNPVFRRFLHELQSNVLDEQIQFVKEELHLKTLITSLNYINSIPLTLLRQKFDVVDDHQYLDHPSFPEVRFRLPFSFKQNSAILRMASLPQNMMGSRIPGKPFIVTEFNYTNPNIYRAEGGPLLGGYASLQDWDALYRFAWSHDDKTILKLNAPTGFNGAGDPMAQLSDRIAIAMFRRGDVESAKSCYSYMVSEDCFDKKLLENFPNDFRNLGLITKIGSAPEGMKKLPPDTQRIQPSDSTHPATLNDQKIATLWKQANEKKLAISSTGQLQLNAETGTFAVNSPCTASVTLKSGSLSAGSLTVKEADCFQTIAAISLDGKPLPQSNSALIIQLTNVANTGVLFENASQKLEKKYGTLPLLVRKGSAIVELASERPGKLTALNCDGQPYGEVKSTYENGILRFKADTTLFPGGVMAYHLTR